MPRTLDPDAVIGALQGMVEAQAAVVEILVDVVSRAGLADRAEIADALRAAAGANETRQDVLLGLAERLDSSRLDAIAFKVPRPANDRLND